MYEKINSSFKFLFSTKAFRIVSIYLTLSLIWIFFTDKLVFNFISDVETLNLVSSIKGWFFVVATTLLLYDLIRRAINEVTTAKQQLIESEIKFRSIFENSVDAIGVSKEGNHVFINPAYLALFGYSQSDEIVGTPVIDLIAPQKREYVLDIVKRRTRGEVVPTAYETIGLRKNGSEFDMDVNVSTYKLNFENYTVVILRNITERKKMENAIRESERSYQTLAEISPVGIFRTDAKGSTTYVNPRWCEISGLPAQEALGDGWLSAVHPDDRQKLISRWKLVTQLQNFSSTEYRFLHADGKIVWVMGNVVPERNLENKIVGFVGTITDITEHRLVVEREKKFSLRISNILESMGDGFVSLDTNWCYTYMNKKAGEIFNRRPEEMIGKNIWREFPEGIGQPFHRAYEKSMKEQTNIQLIEYYPPYDKWFENRIFSSINGLSIFFQDITERKHAEQEIKTKNEELQTLNRIILKTSEPVDLKNRLEFIMDEALKVVGLEGGTICLINPDNTFNLVIDRETSEETINDLTMHKVKIGECLCGNCAKDCKPLILNNREEVLQFATREVLRGEDIRFHAAFPFVVGEKCVGVLCVFTRTDNKPTERRLKLLEMLVAQTAVSIDSASLYKNLKESEEKFRVLLDNSIQGILLIQEERITYVNQAGCKITGYSLEELVGLTMAQQFELVHPDDRPSVIEQQMRFELGEPADEINELRIIRKNGDICWVLTSTKSFTINGKAARLGMMIDITERKKAEEEILRISEKRKGLEFIVNKSQTVAFLWKAEVNWPVEYVSENISQFGYTPEELLSGALPFAKMVYPDDLERVAQEVSHYSQSGINEFVQEYRIITKAGEVRWIDDQTFVRRDHNNKITHYQGIVFDITERKKAEEAIRESEEKFRVLAESTSAAIFIYKGEKFSYINSFAEILTGYTREELINKKFWEIVHPDYRNLIKERGLARLRGEIVASRYEFKIVTKAGEERWLDFTAGLIQFEGEPSGIGTAIDITERKRAFEELQKSRQEFRALSAHLQRIREDERAAIAREMHDELGQILTSLKMSIAFTRRELEESNTIEMKNKILKEFQSMNMTLDKAVSEVRKLITQLRPELLDKLGLIAALEWYSEEYQKSAKISCVFTTKEEELFLDHNKELAIFRIVQEALTNITKHSNAKSVQIRLSKSKDELSVEIIDDGKGILDNELEGATSFGLMGMRERANLIGGDLKIFGAPGKGTTVRFAIGI